MSTCGTCKYFGKPADDNIYVPADYHVCEWIDLHEPGMSSTKIATVVDASGYYAALCVKEDFGCNQWEKK